MTERRIEELAEKLGNSLTDEVEWTIIEETLRECASEQKQIDIERACKEFCYSCVRENDRSCICLDNSKCRLYKDFRKGLEG